MMTVTTRSTEIGVRIALGAQPGRIMAQVVGEPSRPLILPIVAGAGVALLLSRLFRSVLFEVTPADLLAFACVCTLLAGAGLSVISASATPGKVMPSRRVCRDR